MIDAPEGERCQILRLALVLSAGLHFAAMMTLELSPGSWGHGSAPALRAVLKSGEPLLADSDLPAEVPEVRERAARDSAAGDSGRQAPASPPGPRLPTPNRYYKSNEVDVPSMPVVRAPLVYPEFLYLTKLAGMVKARIFIDEHGMVEWVQIVEVKPRPGLFEDAAIDALRQTRYQPAQIAGQPVKSQKLIEITFNPYEE